VPGLGTDGYENKQGDCEQRKAAHGMTPVIDDTEAVPWEFLKTFLLKKKKHSMRRNSVAYGKDNSQKRKNQRPECPSFAVSSRTGPGERTCSSRWRRVGCPLRYPLLPLLPGKAWLQGLRHHSLEQRPKVTPYRAESPRQLPDPPLTTA
jgi:hypothetical protein